MNWLLETGGAIVPIGNPKDTSPPVGIIAGDDVALHSLWLAGSGPSQRAEEARRHAIDLAGQPVEELHVAVGPAMPDGSSWVAIISNDDLQKHLQLFAAAGHQPYALIPAALLLEEGASATLDDLLLFRTAGHAGAAEPALALHLVPTDFVMQAAPFRPPTGDVALPLNLMQGQFAPRQHWWRERKFLIPAAVLATLALLLAVAPAAISARQNSRAQLGFEAGTRQLAHQALGRDAPEDPQLAAKALTTARQQAEGAAIGARLSFLAREVEGVPLARLGDLSLESGTLHITLAGPAEAINGLAPRLAAGPFATDRLGTELLMGNRRPTIISGGPPVAVARQQLVAAGSDSAILASLKKRPKLADSAELAGLIRTTLLAAGLGDAVVTESGSGVLVTIAAARPRVLLPALADLEAAGARFTALSLRPHDDQTLAASFGATP